MVVDTGMDIGVCLGMGLEMVTGTDMGADLTTGLEEEKEE